MSIRKIIQVIFIFVVVIGCKHGNNNNGDVENIVDTVSVVDSSELLLELSGKIRENPRNHTLFYDRANIQFESKNYSEAINDMEIALRLDSLNPNYFNTLGKYYLESGFSGKSLEILLKCVSSFPNNREAHFQLANLYFYVKQYQDALKQIGIIEELDLQKDDSYFLKGMIFREMNNDDASVKSLRKVLEYNPEHWEAYNLLGLIYYEKKDPLAIEYYNTAVMLFPDNIEIRLNSAITCQKFGNIEKSISQYEYVLELDSLNFRAHYNLGYVYLVHVEDYIKAVNKFTNAIDLDSLSGEAFYNRGYAYELSGNISAAINDYQTALKIIPNYELAITGLNSIDSKTL